MLLVLVKKDGCAFLVPDEVAHQAVTALIGVLHLARVTIDRERWFGLGYRIVGQRGKRRHEAEVGALNGDAGHGTHPTNGV